MLPRIKTHKARLTLAFALLSLVLAPAFYFAKPLWKPYYTSLVGGRTIEQAIDLYTPAAQPRLREKFDAKAVTYPPASITLIAFKEEKLLELWANPSDSDPPVLIHTYPILAASGTAGPKLREGDRQVPEGIYRIESLNPNSSYHLSMKLNYPNDYDMQHASAEGRADNPGSNIFIHGKAASIGCLAMGDPAIEELFILAHAVGLDHIQVIILPHDPRPRNPPRNTQFTPPPAAPAWTADLYQQLTEAIKPYPTTP